MKLPSAPPRITIAANNGEVGGGEVMLLHIARALRDLGAQVSVVGPGVVSGEGIVDLAAAEGFSAESLAGGRKEYILQLRRWHRLNRRHMDLLWCNGLVPAFATGGRGARIVHLHRQPEGLQTRIVRWARAKALCTLVPSEFMATKVSGARPLPNWVEPIDADPPLDSAADPLRVGFIGRLGADKGVDVLAQAVKLLRTDPQGIPAVLVLAGESRFVDGAARDQVRQALADLGEHCVRLGWVSPAEFMAAVDLVVVPSVWEEPFGLVAAEAMSARRPVVATKVGALPEVLGATHPYLVTPGDAAQLAQTIRQVAQESAGARQELLDRQYARWEENFSPAAGKAAISQLFHDLHQDLPGETKGRI